MRSLRALLPLALLALAPTAAACDGVSPGDEIVTGDSLCTLAFVLATRDALYFATAGHCGDEGQRVAHAGAELGTFAAKFDDDTPGGDFALVAIDPAVWPDVNPRVCHWGGPIGVYRETPGGGGVRHYGHGVLVGDVPPLRPREGHNLWTDLTRFNWIGSAVQGDSGSAVLADDGRALGVLTHLSLSGSIGNNAGTHLDAGLALAATRGLDLTLVLDGEDPVAVMQRLRDATNETNETAPPPLAVTDPATANDTRPARPTPAAPTPAPTPAPDAPDAAPSVEPLAPAATAGPRETPAASLVATLAAAALAFAATRRR